MIEDEIYFSCFICLNGGGDWQVKSFRACTIATVCVIVADTFPRATFCVSTNSLILSRLGLRMYRVIFVSEARPEATYNWPKVCPWQFSFLYLPFASVLLARAAPRLSFPVSFHHPILLLHSLSLRATNRRNCSTR